jgi:hypothetical protein
MHSLNCLFLGATIKLLRFASALRTFIISHIDFAFHCISSFTTAMDDRQLSKRRKLASLEMETDLNKSSLRQRGSVGRPPHDNLPLSSSVEPATIQPQASNETGQEAPTAQLVPPQEGNAAPVADAPTGPYYNGSSYSGMRGAYPKG